MKRKRSDRNETRMKQTVTKMKQLQPLPSYPLRFHCFLTASFLWLPRPSREGNSRASVSTLHSSVPVTVSGGQEEGDMSRKTLEAPVNPYPIAFSPFRLFTITAVYKVRFSNTQDTIMNKFSMLR